MHSITVTVVMALSAGLASAQHSAVAEPAPLPAPAAQNQFGGGYPPYQFFPQYFGGFNGFGGVGAAQGSSSDASSSSVSTDAGGGGVGAVGSPQQVSFNLGFPAQASGGVSGGPGPGFQQGYHFGYRAAPGGSADTPISSISQPAARGSVGFYGPAPNLGSASPFLGSSGGFAAPTQLGPVAGQFAFGSGEGGAGSGGQFSAPQPQLQGQFHPGFQQFAPARFGGFNGYSGVKSSGGSEARAGPSQAAASSAPGGAVSKHTVTSIQDEISKRQ